MAVVVMATIPILVLYMFFQRYFVEGIAASGCQGLTGPAGPRTHRHRRRREAPATRTRTTSPSPWTRLSLPRALRRAAVDFYYQSIRLVPANIVWGIVLVALGLAAISLGTWVAIVGAPLLGPPLAGIFRLAGLVTRGRHVVLTDAFEAARELFVPALLLAAAVGWGSGSWRSTSSSGSTRRVRWAGCSRRSPAGAPSRC